MAERGTKRSQTSSANNHPQKRQKKDPSRAKYRAQAAQTSGRASISQNAIQAGDVGLFLTSDKGKEKAALREMEDLLEVYMERMDGHDGVEAGEGGGEGANDAHDGHNVHGTVENGSGPVDRRAEGVGGSPSIEDEIAAELNELRGDQGRSASAVSNGVQPNDNARGDKSTSATSHKLGLITLDIPCVSFVRFPTSSHLDPVSTVLEILRDAAAHPTHQRSRFIKRLTPMTKIRKVLNQGLDEVCGEVLASHFSLAAPTNSADGAEENGSGTGTEQLASSSGLSTTEAQKAREARATEKNTESAPTQSGSRYRIEVTRRQSDHLSRDEIIQTVAEHVNRLGLGQHKVDLKTWEKAILVEVYRGIVGMSVIDVGNEEWEGILKRGNLAEVYAAARQRQQNQMQKVEQES